MHGLRPGARRWVAVALAAIVLLGGALRASAAADPLPELSADGAAYSKLALSIARGTYGDAESRLKSPLHWPPGAPFMFAASQVLDRSPDLGAAYWLQALVGTLTVVACFGIAALAAGPVAGLVAAALVAVYPPSIALTRTLQSEPLGALLAALAVLAAAWALRRDGRARWWALSGVLFGGAVLTRTDLLLAPPLVAGLVALVLLGRVGRRAALTSAAVLLAAYVAAIAPWTAYVSQRAGAFTPVTEGDAAALFVGTYLPGDGTTFGMKRDLADDLRARNPKLREIRNPDAIEARAFLNYISDRRPELSREAALQAEARANLRRYALGRPVAFARMMVDKVRRTWFLSSRAGAKGKSTAVRIYHAALVALCCAAMLVAVALRRSAVVGICLALVAYSMLLHAVFVAKPRYALPLMPLLMVGGVVAVAILVARRRAGSDPPGSGRSTERTASAVASAVQQ